MRPPCSARRLFRRCAMLAGALLVLCARCPGARADAVYSAAVVKAAYLYRFAGYVRWPGPQQAGSAFVIDVMAGSAVASDLERLLPDHPINGHPARVRVISDISDLGDAQMLYVGPDFKGNVRKLIASLGNRPVLVVTDESQGLNDGGTINFVESGDGHLRFEVSLTAAERAGLRISSQLLSVAVRVTGAHLRSGTDCHESGITRELSCGCEERDARAVRKEGSMR